MLRENFKIEICANSVESAWAAFKGGADRVELCAGMPEGGTTPSYGDMVLARELLPIGLHVIIRPRGGDFLYSDLEMSVMLKDIEMACKIGVEGVVVGCLTREGEVDVRKLEKLKAAAGDRSVTFHRAFDMCREPFEALRVIEEVGCDRILTSGQQRTAEEGIPLLKQLTEQAKRVVIMPGCGINAANIRHIALRTGAREFHFSAREGVESEMSYRNPTVEMGGTVHIAEYAKEVTHADRVCKTIQALLDD